jgi:hypothetical protein
VNRARRLQIGLSVALAGVAVGGRARADNSGMLEVRQPDAGRSAQNFAMEVRVALYNPQVDSDGSLKGNPYASAFGPSQRYEVAMEFDWQALRIPHVGTLGPAISLGYTKSTAIAPRADGGQPPSEETTSLEIFPMYAVAVFRLDVLMRDAHVPLVPYAKAGLGYALWRSSNTAGTSVAPDGVVAKGHTFGTQLAAGMAFALGVIDPNASRQLDESTGINNTYIFGEVMMADLTGLGQSHALWVGSNSFVFGLAFEF